MAVYVYKGEECQLIDALMLDTHLAAGWSVTKNDADPDPDPDPDPEPDPEPEQAESVIEETEKALKDAIKDKIENLTGKRPGNRSTLESLEKTLAELEGGE